MSEDQAKQRWLTIQMVRLLGLASLVLGMLVISGKLDWPVIAGILLALNGVADIFIIPQLMARKWRSPRE